MLWDGETLAVLHMGMEPVGGHEKDSFYSGPVSEGVGLQQKGSCARYNVD